MKEQQLGLPSSMTVSKVPHELARSQLGFIKYLVEPLIRSYAEFHNNSHWIANVRHNLAEWERRCAHTPAHGLAGWGRLTPPPLAAVPRSRKGEASGAAKGSEKAD